MIVEGQIQRLNNWNISNEALYVPAAISAIILQLPGGRIHALHPERLPWL